MWQVLLYLSINPKRFSHMLGKTASLKLTPASLKLPPTSLKLLLASLKLLHFLLKQLPVYLKLPTVLKQVMLHLPIFCTTSKPLTVRCCNLITLIIICLSALPYSSTAQNDTVHLKEVDIYGIKPAVTTNSVIPIQQLTIKELNTLPSSSVAEAIRQFSGVVIKDFGGVGGLKTVMIQSLGSNHTSVFIDGHPSTDAATGQIDIGRISLQDVSGIQLSIGQPQFGPVPARMFASASMLNITTVEPVLTDKKAALKLSLRAGSFGTYNPAANIDWKVKNNITSGIRLNHFNSTGKFPYNVHNGNNVTGFIRSNSDVATTDGTFKTNILLNDSSKLKIRMSYYHSERGLPGAIIFYNSHSRQRLKNTDLNAAISYRNREKARVAMLTSAGFSNSRLLYTDPDFLNQEGGLKNEYHQQEYYLSEAVAFTILKNLKMAIASDVVFSKLNTNAYSINEPQRTTSLSSLTTNYLLKNTEFQGNLLMTAVSDNQTNLINKNYLKLSPALSVLQSITPDHSVKIRLSHKNIFRMPTFNELYYTLLGNKNLKPEQASLSSLGVMASKALLKPLDSI
jgi:vitamin B12 transporter